MKKARSGGISLSALFSIISFLGLLATFLCFMFSRTELWSKFFWYNRNDGALGFNETGMDFFHSIEYLNGNSPYAQWRTIYPPLANLIFKVFFLLVPEVQKSQWPLSFRASLEMRTTANDLRVWMPTLMMFTVLFVAVAAMVCLFIARYLRNKRGGLAAFFMLFSYGFLYALERGNIIVLAMAASLFFALYYDSSTGWVREVALVSLAFAANLKMYPAVLGLLLLCDKRWSAAARAVLYGVLLFVLPCLTFDERLSSIPIFLNNVTRYADRVKLNNVGLSFDKMLMSVATILKHTMGKPVSERFFYDVAPKLNYLFLPLGVACGVILPRKWQKSLCCMLAFILYSSQGLYASIFLIIPAVLFLKEEKTLTWANVVPFIGFVLGIVCLPVFNVGDLTFSFTGFRLQWGVALLTLYMLAAALRALLARGRARRAA